MSRAWMAGSVFWSVALASVVGVARAEDAPDPVAFLETSVNEVLDIVYSHDKESGPLSARLKPLLDERFDLAGITRRAVGRPWLKFTPEQQKKAIDLFSTVVLRTYADRFEPKSRPTMEYGRAIHLAKDRWELPTTVGYEGNKYAVSYRVQSFGSDWRVYDVIIEGVSMVGNYREQFDAIIQKGGAKALLESLEENVAREGSSP